MASDLNANSSPEFTVVMTTYSGESAENLREAILSIVKQTLVPSRLVLVLDGPVPDGQITVIDECRLLASFHLRVVALSDNKGRGVARNIGIEHADSEFIALMDSDDISLPTRFRTQVDFLRSNPEVDVLAGWTEEFYDGSVALNSRGAVKYCPTNHEGIASSLRWTNCVANPTIVMRKSCWEAVGGFPDYKDINEDYLFYYRLLAQGARFACVPHILLKVRISLEQRRRRKGARLLISDYRFRLAAFREGHVGFVVTVITMVLISVRRLAPLSFGNLMQYSWRRLSKVLYS